jgi:NAD(P)H-nitrite reductase large subunit
MEAIIMQTNDAYVVIPSTPAGLITGEQLAKIAELVNQGAGLAKLTTGQRIGILTTEDKIEDVRRDLESVGLKIGPAGAAIRNVKGCPGALCEYAKQDALKHAIEIDNKFFGKEMPNALKISVSGCPRNCTEARSQDIGFVGTPKGYKLYVGGKGGGNQLLGELLDEAIQPEEMVDYVDHIINVYTKEAKGKERISRTIGRVGIDSFKR